MLREELEEEYRKHKKFTHIFIIVSLCIVLLIGFLEKDGFWEMVMRGFQVLILHVAFQTFAWFRWFRWLYKNEDE